MTSEHLDGLLRKLTWRIVPLLAVLYVVSYLDRVNVSFAALTMNADLGISATAYGWGAGIFFIGYLLFQVPSNLLLEKHGPKRWLAIIMVAWGLVSIGMGFIRNEHEFLIGRFLLGIAEAGFFPGTVLYLTYWFPPSHRARIIAGFMFGVPVATIIGAPISSYILGHFQNGGPLAGWRWLFVIEGAPALIGAAAVLWLLPDRPATAGWLSPEVRTLLLGALSPEEKSNQPRKVSQIILSAPVFRYALAYFGLTISLYGVGLWLPQILKGSGVSTTSAALFSAIPYIVAGLGMLAWGQFADRQSGALPSNVWIPALAAAVALGLLPFSGGLVSELVLLSVAALGTLASIATFWTLPTNRFDRAESPIAIAAINSFGNLGGFLGPFMVGWIKDATGSFKAAAFFMAAWALITVMSLAVERRRAAKTV